MRVAVALLCVAPMACSSPSPVGRSAVETEPHSAPAPSATTAPTGSVAPAAPAVPRLARTLISGARFDNPTPIVVDDTNVYVSSGGILLVVPKDGSKPAESVFAKTQIVSAFTADATDLYMGIYPADGPGPEGAIVRVDKKTRTPTVLTRTKMLTAIAVDDEQVWFGLLSDGAYRVDKKGGKPKAVFTGRGQVTAIAQDSESVYFGVTRYGSKQRAEVDLVKKKGGDFSIFTTDTYDLMGLLPLPDAIYMNDNGVVKRFPRAGGPAEKVSGIGSVVGLTHRGAEVLFCDIVLADKTQPAGVLVAGQPPQLLSAAPGAVGIAADDRTVYWADATARTLTALDL